MKFRKCLAVLLTFIMVFSCAFTAMADMESVEVTDDFLYVKEADVAHVEVVVEDTVAPVTREEAAAGTSLLGESAGWEIGSPTKADVIASLSSDGKTLTITGSGAMMDFTTLSDADIPWYSKGDSITSVIIENGVTTIGNHAFHDCSGLESITIPSGVESIGDFAFYECSSLASVAIPSTVTTIGKDAFTLCTKLENITIPSGVTSIGEFTFANCNQLTDVTIPFGVTSIGGHAFSYCNGLTSITISSSVESIGEWAFFDCPSLQSVKVEAETPASLGSGAFSVCDKLNHIFVPAGSVDAYKTEWEDYKGKITCCYTITADINNPAFGTVDPISVTVAYGTTAYVVDDYVSFSDGQKMTAVPKKGYMISSLGTVQDADCIKSNSGISVEFRPIENKVTFDSKGGTEVAYTMVFTGEKIPKPSDPEREDYMFLGWAIGETETLWNFDTDVVEDNMTLTAVWAAIPEVKITFKVSEGIETLYFQIDDEIIPFEAGDLASEPKTFKQGDPVILVKVDCRSGYVCPMFLPDLYVVPDHDDTITIIAVRTSDPKPNPTPTPSGDDDDDNTPLFTGTWNNPVKGGIWTKDSHGVWHFSYGQLFRGTWGYIVNPYAGEGQNKADWFWFDENGNMLTGWQFINGKWYYLNPTKDGTLGACLIGPAITPDGYEVDASGAWTGR